MKKKTRMKRCYPTIIGKRFFDAGEYGLGYFTVIKAWKYKEYCSSAKLPNGSHWFSKEVILIRTDAGVKFKIPFCPWTKVVFADTGELWDKEFNNNPW